MRAALLSSLLLGLVVSLGGCTRDLPLPASGEPGKPVLLGELTGGDTFSVRGSGSAPVATGATVPVPEGMVVLLSGEDGATQALPGQRDALTEELRTLRFSAAARTEFGKTYTLVARHATLGEASVSVTVPRIFTAAVTDTVRATREGLGMLRFRIQIDDPGGEQYYVVELLRQPVQLRNREFLFGAAWKSVDRYRQQYDSLKAAHVPFPERADTAVTGRPVRLALYTDDASTENLQDGGAPVAYRRILLSDRAFSGPSYTTAVEVRNDALLAAHPEERGRVLLQVKSVTKEYFEFLKSYERYGKGSGGSGDITVLKGNVAGGYGAVGGVAKREWVYVFDRWE